MKNIVIPALLLGVVMIAGGAAVMQVEQAQAVHTTISSAQGTPFHVVDTFTTGVSDVARHDYRLDCTTDCIVTGIHITGFSDTTGNVGSISNIEVDGIELIGTDIAAAGNDVREILLADTAIGDVDERLEQIFTGQTAAVAVDLVIGTTTGPATDALHMLRYLEGGIANGGGIAPVTAGTEDIVLEIDQSTQGTNTSTYVITWSGFMVGTTEPVATNAVG